MRPSRSCWNGTSSALQSDETTSKGLEFHVGTINKSAHTKSLETYLMILVGHVIHNDILQINPILRK